MSGCAVGCGCVWVVVVVWWSLCVVGYVVWDVWLWDGGVGGVVGVGVCVCELVRVGWCVCYVSVCVSESVC